MRDYKYGRTIDESCWMILRALQATRCICTTRQRTRSNIEQGRSAICAMFHYTKIDHYAFGLAMEDRRQQCDDAHAVLAVTVAQ